MNLKTFFISVLYLVIFPISIFSSINDSVYYNLPINYDSISETNVHQPSRFSVKKLILPCALIGVSIVGLESHGLKKLNTHIRDKFSGKHIGRTHIDDYLQFVPAASVYALGAFGLKGKHNFLDKTVILATASALMGTTVITLKKTTGVQRPDGSAFNSYPSGHTAMAFMGAEFLCQEYRDQSVWIGISGYVVATGTGILRITNNRHWLNDVIAGAGIGILCTRAAYWLFPFIRKIYSPTPKKGVSVQFSPYHNDGYNGLSCQFNF